MERENGVRGGHRGEKGTKETERKKTERTEGKRRSGKQKEGRKRKSDRKERVRGREDETQQLCETISHLWN